MEKKEQGSGIGDRLERCENSLHGTWFVALPMVAGDG